MNASHLIVYCKVLGIRLRVEDGRLKYAVPNGVLDPELRAELFAHKAELIELLSGPAPEPAPPTGTATDFPWRTILPSWPIEWREKWALRANELAEAGVPHPADEDRAFEEVLREREAGIEPPPIAAPEPPAGPSAEATGSCPWRCQNPFCRDGSRWWRSCLVILCANCTPPTFPGSVIERGDVSDAPLVEAGRSTQVFEPAGGAHHAVA